MELNETPDTAVVITTAKDILTISEKNFKLLVMRACNTWQQPPEEVERLRDTILRRELSVVNTIRRRCTNCQGTGAIISDTEETQCLACNGVGQI